MHKPLKNVQNFSGLHIPKSQWVYGILVSDIINIFEHKCCVHILRELV